MTTFCSVNDEVLAELIRKAQHRIVYIAPGLFKPVADALCSRFDELGRLDVTLILDPGEDVCRIGFGELAALQQVHRKSSKDGFFVRDQPGLRMGTLLVDDQTLVWSPTPRSVEAPPDTGDGALPRSPAAPNGMLLGINPCEQIALAACAEGTNTDPREAEVGTSVVTPDMVANLAQVLTDNPPIPVDLARVKRVFSTKLQFVELKVKGARLARRQLSVSSELLNADAQDGLRSLLNARLRAFADFRDEKVDVPTYADGEPAYTQGGEPARQLVSETDLDRERRAIESDLLYKIPGFGCIIERARCGEFEKRVKAYRTRVTEHAAALRKMLQEKTDTIVKETVTLINGRIAQARGTPLDTAELAHKLKEPLDRIRGEAPTVTWVFKEITYEQTGDENFKRLLAEALTPAAKRRLGNWCEQFNVAKER